MLGAVLAVGRVQPAFDLQNIEVCRGLSRMRKTAPAVEPRVIGLSIVTPKAGWVGWERAGERE